jgi:glycosyltransferase involved in cell wall biosynthesis
LLDNPQDSPFRKWRHRRYRRSSLVLADAVIATSSEFAELASAYCDPKKIIVIPNGVDTDDFNASRTAPASLSGKYHSEQVILAVRRLVPKNGIQYLVQAAPRILKLCPEARFIIGGWGSQEEELKRLAEGLELLHALISGGFLIPKFRLSCAGESRGLPLPWNPPATHLEAMAMGKPGGQPFSGLAELLGENGRGVLVDFDSSGSSYHAPVTLRREVSDQFADAIVAPAILPCPSSGSGREYALAHFGIGMFS